MLRYIASFVSWFFATVICDYLIFIFIFSQLPDQITSQILGNSVLGMMIYAGIFIVFPGLVAYHFTLQNKAFKHSNRTMYKKSTFSTFLSLTLGLLLMFIFQSVGQPKYAPYSLVSIKSDELADPVKFSVKDVQVGTLADDFHTRSTNIFDSDLHPMECVKWLGVVDPLKIDLLFPVKSLANFISTIQYHRFNGSIRDISFNTVCRSNGRYLFLISITESDTNLGDGEYPQVSFVYTSGDTFKVLENAGQCQDIVGISDNYAYLKCEYGDESTLRQNIRKITFSSGKSNITVSCETKFINENKSRTICTKSGVKYYTR